MPVCCDAYVSFLARSCRAGGADQCPKLGVERTQRRDAAKVESNPFQTSAARFALTQTDVPKCDSLNLSGLS